MTNFAKSLLAAVACLSLTSAANAQIEIDKDVRAGPGRVRPIFLALNGISGEAAQVIQTDLYVQGFAFTNSEAAQYIISGSSDGSLQARVQDRLNQSVILSKAYSGASMRRQAHAFSDDFVVQLKRKPIAQTMIAFKAESGKGSEIYIADFDAHNAQEVTKDGSTVYAPTWVPGRMALLYGSYKLNNADIFMHNLTTGARKAFARYGGSSMSPAVSPDGKKVAMILSKDGWTDLYVCDIDGSDLKRLTKSPQDESSPCWSPDSQWICFAGKERERRALFKVAAGGGGLKVIPTRGVPSPTEPDWSPDGKQIAFTAQFRSFQICVVDANGGDATMLVEGEDPSWSPNSRTLVYGRRQGSRYVLSLLDVPTKQYKDVSRISGSNSQSQPSWAR
jgi:TolB protein